MTLNFAREKSRNVYARGCASLFTLLLPSLALAQQPCGDTTCDVGYECTSYEPGCPTILIAIDCPEGQECASPEQPSCEPGIQYYCAPAACETDADCADYMECASFEQYDCPPSLMPEPAAGAACAEGQRDEECALALEQRTGSECTTLTVKECTPRWNLPCEQANDCGEGFDCVPELRCSCGGSPGATMPGDIAAPDGTTTDRVAEDVAEPVDRSDGAPTAGSEAELLAPDDAACVCEPGERNYCEPIEQACQSDADCPAAWSCSPNPSGSCTSDSSGNTSCTDSGPALVCQPPQHLPGAVAVDGLGATSSVREENVESPSSPDLNDPSGPISTPGASGPGEQSDVVVDPSSDRARGCSVSNGPAPASPLHGIAVLLGALGLVVARRRPR